MLHFSRWKTLLIWLVAFAAVVVVAPNLLSEAQRSSLPDWLRNDHMTLGLDLQGGSHIVLKVERSDIVKDRLEEAVANVRNALRGAGIRYTGLTGNGQTVTVRITDPAETQKAVDLLKPTTTAGGQSELALQQGGEGQLSLQISDAGIAADVVSTRNRSLDVVGRRITGFGYKDFQVRPEGADRIAVQVLGSVDAERLKNILNQPAKLSFRLLDESMSGQEALNGRWPATSEVLYSLDDPPVPYLVDRTAFVTGANMIDIEPAIDPQTQDTSIVYRLDAEGTQRLAEATSRNIGKHLAIVFDDQVMSSPVIDAAITGGEGRISANFSEDGVRDLAVMLRAGALPATLTSVEERSISPSFGADSIVSGLVAGLVAVVLVAALMIALYRILGVIAVVSLFFNLILIVAGLSLAGATLTLPGIAGIVLIVGMAVDSNVLIYERIREEERAGPSFAQAVDRGFSRAFATIVDANVTIFIAAIILLFLGSESIRGFAVTLAAGILTTVITAFTLTRSIVAVWLKARHPRHLPKSVVAHLFEHTNVRFMGIRRYVFTASAAISLIAMAAFATVGLQLGIDFTGGSLIEVTAKQGNADIDDLRSRLDELNLGEVSVEPTGRPSNARIRIASQGGGENAEQSAATLVRGELSADYDFRRVEVVGPAISGELTMMATLGIVAALAAILIYIWIRFEWQFAVGAIVATLHDVIIMLGLFVLTGIEFNLTSIAAVLTIVGYSLNDTVVVYDRMRENLKRYRKMPLPILIDASINQTLSRTVLTAATTLLALLALYLFGGDVIRSFSFAMLFGVALGTFSSIYIAAPVLIVFRLRPEASNGEESNKTDAGVRSGTVV
ncbi:protein translocase subunit SecDF [Rhizobium lentis]|uniref:protein translocase subunit SecDF n=1 Tax=Rhizobium lentis TaxID=1138194 RepID=UPI001C83A35D|nr:protein translocase subunit SecDF [Rhizobium lentis]MBX4954002.1 protein translocase subunit SecDF [Rhizobium lentis]MBX4972475.1 protein translocase subunit SecDF [Rhizobium lentis]MBX4984014.1 protein translocase subunit SecDF [Rhizobium lentis]MBX4999612.1 protein translocase subunit SecDF [Rhizobium lentis]MBX5002964.1 protein translocase subunit SecDF [Rhizobium lentis]